MSGRKTTGLAHNPLLARTDTTDEPATASGARATPDQTGTQLPAEDVTHEHVDTSTGIQVNSQAGTHVDTSTRILDRSLKFTFYFSEEQLDRLDHVWETLRRSRRRPRRRISKSQFVRLALDNLLDEFEKDPDQVTGRLLQHVETPPRP